MRRRRAAAAQVAPMTSAPRSRPSWLTRLGAQFRACRQGADYVPFAFSPALSDAHRDVQEAYLDAAQNLPGSEASLVEALRDIAKDEQGEGSLYYCGGGRFIVNAGLA